MHTGARVALCELPFSLVQTDTEGGLGGTCILRGCIPKKFLVYGGEYANEFKECEGYGYAIRRPSCCRSSVSTLQDTLLPHAWRTLRIQLHWGLCSACLQTDFLQQTSMLLIQALCGHDSTS